MLPDDLAKPVRVTLVNIDLPFDVLVRLMLKWSFACIPAAIVFGTVVAFVVLLFGAIARLII